MTTHRRLAETRFESLQKKYDWRAKWHGRRFRASGVLVITISSALPLLAGFSYPGKDAPIAFAGVTIATATGLRTFYQWDQMWSLLRRSHFELTYAFHHWNMDFVQAELMDDPRRREKLAREATRTFLEKIEVIRAAESDKFFNALAFPEAGVGRAVRPPPQQALDPAALTRDGG
ncbi:MULTISPECIES: SLATT domain-containing protein [unclassified Micromonospora]|uniref:SLATT domain-containing protein n=1 Tax=unclassified Micromonospora TaxID=2617518 RepID=UPI00363D10B8